MISVISDNVYSTIDSTTTTTTMLRKINIIIIIILYNIMPITIYNLRITAAADGRVEEGLFMVSTTDAVSASVVDGRVGRFRRIDVAGWEKMWRPTRTTAAAAAATASEMTTSRQTGGWGGTS
jgi:hypothetical protein